MLSTPINALYCVCGYSCAPRVKRTSCVSMRKNSARCRGIYPLFVVSNRHPFAPAELPAFIATMGASGPLASLSPPPCPRPRGSGLSGSARIVITRRRRDLLGYCSLSMSCSIRPRIPGGRIRLACDAGYVIACWLVETIGHRRKKAFSGLNTFTDSVNRSHCTSHAFVSTHQARYY